MTLPKRTQVYARKSTDVYVHRAISFRLIANKNKLDELNTLLNILQEAADVALHLYKVYIPLGFLQRDVERFVEKRLRHQFPNVYSKTIQKLNKLVVSSTLSKSVKKLMQTRNVNAIAIFDKQMCDLRHSDNHFKYWLRVIGLRNPETKRFRRLNIALVGERPSLQLHDKSEADICEFRILRRTSTKSKGRRSKMKTCRRTSSLRSWLVVQVVIADTCKVPTSEKQCTNVIGIDYNYKSLEMTDGTRDEHVSLEAHVERSLQHRSNKRRMQRFGLDFIEKLTTRLVDDFIARNIDAVIVEDLKGIRKSARRDLKINKGRHFRYIVNNSMPFGYFNTRLQDKCKRAGIRVVVVDPAYTSQGCSCCGFTHAKNRLTTEGFCCGWCGHAEHSGLNAARNIRKRGLAALHNDPDADLVKRVGLKLLKSDR